MQGCTRTIALGLLALLGGCTKLPDPLPEEPPVPALAQCYDSSRTGSIRGRVCWKGKIPASESTLVRAIAYHPRIHLNPIRYETTHLPRVNAENQGVADAIVFLRGVDPRQAKPWNHAEVRVEFRARQMRMRQGSVATNAGFILKGHQVATINHDADFHALRGRGAAFFTLPLLTPDRVSTQKLIQPGLVELFDAGGYYWSHAHLFVVEHPYYVRTDADGNFSLEEVPAGTYEIVSWMPSWHIARKEIDPETAVIARMVWESPQEQRQTVQVQKGEKADILFRWSQKMFGPAAVP